MKVLIAEDDNVSALILRKSLERMNHTVTTAKDGNLAWECAKADPPDVLISDWMMPGMDGLELCRQIRATQEHSYIYFILLTAKGRREDRTDGMRAGADDFLIKPLDPEELAARLKVAQRIISMQRERNEDGRELARLHGDMQRQNDRLTESLHNMEQANRRFMQLFHGLPIACFTYNSEGRIQEWNRSAEALYGLTAAEATEKVMWDVVNLPEDQTQTREIVRQVFQGERFENLEFEDRRNGDQDCWVLCNTYPLKGSADEIIGAISANIDITERKLLEQRIAGQLAESTRLYAELEIRQGELAEANSQLAELASIDPLTGLSNRRQLMDALKSSMSMATRESLPISVLMIDVDRFKDFNDSFGHPEGDRVLIGLAQILLAAVRGHDIVARYGGEEFTVILVGADLVGASAFAERIREEVEAHRWPLAPVTVSIGVAELDPQAAVGLEIFGDADSALYRAKTLGRNRIAAYTRDIPKLTPFDVPQPQPLSIVA